MKVRLSVLLRRRSTRNHTKKIEDTVNSMKIGKAEGRNKISQECIKYGGKQLGIILLQLSKVARKKEQMPNVCKGNIIVPIYKKEETTEFKN